MVIQHKHLLNTCGIASPPSPQRNYEIIKFRSHKSSLSVLGDNVCLLLLGCLLCLHTAWGVHIFVWGHCFLRATTSRDLRYQSVRLWSSHWHCRVWLWRRVIHVRVHRYGKLSELIDMLLPNCLGFDSNFAGQGSRMGCDDSRHPPNYPAAVAGNNGLPLDKLVLTKPKTNPQ